MHHRQKYEAPLISANLHSSHCGTWEITIITYPINRLLRYGVFCFAFSTLILLVSSSQYPLHMYSIKTDHICFNLVFIPLSFLFLVQAAGGATGFPMTLSCLQLGVGVLYALFLWSAPDARSTPKISFNDVKRLLPVGICFAGAHAGSVFAMGAGAVSFAQVCMYNNYRKL